MAVGSNILKSYNLRVYGAWAMIVQFVENVGPFIPVQACDACIISIIFRVK